MPTVRDWKDLNLNHIDKAVINQDSCIQCGRCHVACEDTSHQAITFSKEGGVRRFEVDDTECVGCNLCVSICPVPGVTGDSARSEASTAISSSTLRAPWVSISSRS